MKPVMESEEFLANEYVAACYQGLELLACSTCDWKGLKCMAINELLNNSQDGKFEAEVSGYEARDSVYALGAFAKEVLPPIFNISEENIVMTEGDDLENSWIEVDDGNITHTIESHLITVDDKINVMS